MSEDNYSLSSRVFHTIRENILSGKYATDEELKEKSIGEELGVSRTPVREAIRMLELEGLVVMVPRKGAEVARITEKDLRDALEIRLSLEELAVELACKRIDEEGRLRLREACENFREAVRSGRVSDIVDTDVAFHETICELSNNPRLVSLTKNYGEQVYRYRVEYVRDTGYHGKLLREHDEITEAILLGDVEKAKAVMHQHIYDQEQIVIQNIKQKQDTI